jgi:hypothetical protein
MKVGKFKLILANYQIKSGIFLSISKSAAKPEYNMKYQVKIAKKLLFSVR